MDFQLKEKKKEKKLNCICLSCIHKKTDYEGDNYCKVVNHIPKEIADGLIRRCSFYNKK